MPLQTPVNRRARSKTCNISQAAPPLLALPQQNRYGGGVLGFERARGARPDSPGVARDIPRAEEAVADEVWEKRLYTRSDDGVILHFRRSDSPWGHYTVWFRDWLRAHPEARQSYESTKRALAEQNTGTPDYDDYTRAKSAFFDDVHQTFVDWAQTQTRR
jgi:GrpB-like predicted nucleotidyltransferase (UPF0157 family)